MSISFFCKEEEEEEELRKGEQFWGWEYGAAAEVWTRAAPGRDGTAGDLNDCQKWATGMPLCADGMGKSKRDAHPLSGHFCHFYLFHKCLWTLRTAVLLSCEPKAYRLQAPGFGWKEFPYEEPSIADFFCGSLPVSNYLYMCVYIFIYIHTYVFGFRTHLAMLALCSVLKDHP